MRDSNQNIDDIIKAATTEQKILWQQVLLICGGNCAIRPLHYTGPTGAEFDTYINTKLYLVYSLEYSHSNPSGAAAGIVYYYNQANVVHGYGFNNYPFFNSGTLTANATSNNIKTKNTWFSRQQCFGYNFMIFTGFRIIY